MGIFFDHGSPPTEPRIESPVVADVVVRALSTTPKSPEEAQRLAAQMSAQIAASTPPSPPPGPRTFQWLRFAGALLFLALLFAAGIYCAHDDKLQDWSKVLLHSFEVLLGAVVGIVIGEGTRG